MLGGSNNAVVNDVAIDPSCQTRLYAAFGFVQSRAYGTGGVSVSVDNGATWTSTTVGTTLHTAPVSDVEVDKLDPRYVYAASYGHGFFSYDWGANKVPACQ